jgi:hypothetical protein
MIKRYLILVGLIIFCAFPVNSEINTKGHNCFLPAQNFAEVSDCVIKNKTGQLFIAPVYLRQLSFTENGLATIYSQEEGWMYVNRKGKVIISGVAVMDNGADTFHDGLVRFIKDTKWGFADEKGHVVVPAVYDGALNFVNGIAKVCTGCKNECVYAHCEARHHVGGEWFCIDTKGKRIENCPP